MNATVFTIIEFALFFGFIFLVGFWQLREIDRDQKKAADNKSDGDAETGDHP